MPASTILYAVIQRRSHINKFIIIIFNFSAESSNKPYYFNVFAPVGTKLMKS